MSIPVQDRIYRSRLTLKYRTNIDGMPVPQTLPLRLLVLADLTGGKKSTDKLTEDRLLPNRRIVSILRGMNVDDIIEEMNIAFPIPRSDDPALKLLRERAYVAGTFGGDDAAPLGASLEDVENDGGTVITGTVPFSATVYENARIALNGPLEVVTRVAFDPVKIPTTPAVALKGRINVPVADKSKLDTVVIAGVTVDATSGKLSVKLTSATAKLFHADQDPAATAEWLSAAIKADAVLTGSKPADGAEATFEAEGVVTVVNASVEYPLTVKARIPLAKDAQGGFAAAQDQTTASYQVSGSLSIAVKTSVTLDKLFEGSTAGSPIEVPVQRTGSIVKKFAPASTVKVTLVNDDTTPTSAPQVMPTYSVEGALSGTIESSVRSFLGGSSSIALESGKPVEFAFPLDVTFTTAQKTSALLKGDVAGAKGSATLVVSSLHGRVWGKKDEQARDAVPVRSEDVVVDVDATSVDVSACKINLEPTASGDLGIDVALHGSCTAYRSMRIRNLDSFTPDAVAASVPEIRRLQIVSDLLTQLKSDVNLIPSVRDSVATLLKKADADGKTDVLRQKLAERFPPLVVNEYLPVGDAGAAPAAPRLLSDADKGWYEAFFADRDNALVKAAQIKDTRKKKLLSLIEYTTVAGSTSLSQVDFHDYDSEDRVTDQDRLLTGLAALLINDTRLDSRVSTSELGNRIDEVVKRIKAAVTRCVSHMLLDDDFRYLERNWRDVAELCKVVETDRTVIDLLDLGPQELVKDMKEHASDIFTSELFKRLYLEEYDRYGGKPFSAMIGLYHITDNDEDMATLTTLSEIANAAHCPFVGGIAPTFFGSDIETWSDLDSVGDIEAHLSMPRFGKWNTLRDSMEAPYLGLTLPGYLSRKPWSADEKQLGNRILHDETAGKSQAEVSRSYLWGNSAVLFGQNLVRSFEASGWCQYIRGVKGGGLVQGMTVHTVQRHGKEETQSPVEFEIPDYRELQFSKAGLIPLVHCKGSSDAAFFSAQSLKKPRDFRSEIDTQNAYLVTNLAYTFSITRIAHYVKRMMRDYIGSTADVAYIQNVLQLWLNDYITTTVNPDDLTLRYYPFKAVAVTVVPKPGPLGWYKAVISILPHIQFEGMDVELRLEAALGGK